MKIFDGPVSPVDLITQSVRHCAPDVDDIESMVSIAASNVSDAQRRVLLYPADAPWTAKLIGNLPREVDLLVARRLDTVTLAMRTRCVQTLFIGADLCDASIDSIHEVRRGVQPSARIVGVCPPGYEERGRDLLRRSSIDYALTTPFRSSAVAHLIRTVGLVANESDRLAASPVLVASADSELIGEVAAILAPIRPVRGYAQSDVLASTLNNGEKCTLLVDLRLGDHELGQIAHSARGVHPTTRIVGLRTTRNMARDTNMLAQGWINRIIDLPVTSAALRSARLFVTDCDAS